MNKTKLGHINFLNCLPLTYSIQNNHLKDFDITSAVPSALNEAIVGGRLDISPVSAVIYARNSEKLRIMPNVSISAEGAIRSLILESKRPITELDGAQIGLTSKSANTHCILKIILQKGYGVQPEYTIDEIVPNQPGNYDATLLIGDDALYTYHHRVPGYHYYDIGGEWRKLTGLPLVCAVWVVNEQYAEEHPREVAVAAKKIAEGFRFGLKNKEEAIATINDRSVFTDTQLEEYLGVLNWGFTPRHQEALQYLYQEAYALGLVPCVPKIKIAEVDRP